MHFSNFGSVDQSQMIDLHCNLFYQVKDLRFLESWHLDTSFAISLMLNSPLKFLIISQVNYQIKSNYYSFIDIDVQGV